MRRTVALGLALVAMTTPARADAPTGMYVDKTEVALAVVVDTYTGLTWLRDASPNIALSEAPGWCSAKGAGWIVPTYPETATLMDLTRAIGTESMIDPVHFPKTPLLPFWTSSRTKPANLPLTMGFDGPGAGLNDRDSKLPVRCVKRP